MKSKVLGILFVAATALPTLAGKTKPQALTTLTVSVDPTKVVLPGMESRPCNHEELSDTWNICEAVAVIRGGKVSAVYCSVRSSGPDRTCVIEPVLGSPMAW